MKKILFVILLSISFKTYSQNNSKIIWNGYAQTRFTTNFDDNNNFALRRFKFWIESNPEFSENWSYKVQTTISSFKDEKFLLQDVKLSYKKGLFSFDFGQFVPEYSLERFQSDYKLAIIERAKAINSLIPNGTLGVRDIGFQTNFYSKNKIFQSSIGVFNGYGILVYKIDNKGYMITNKTAINIPLKNSLIKTGYSIQYRKAENLFIHNVFADSISFSGNDFRYNFFIMFKSKVFNIQAEYLNANFNGKKAFGYYILSQLNIKKNQVIFSFEDYNDLIEETTDNPFYRIGYNHEFNSYKTKLFFDNYFQINNSKIKNYLVSVQLQIFFN